MSVSTELNKLKRVWCLYRVSTKKQLTADDDIPTQREQCRNYAKAHSNWKISNELYERGISGWKKSIDERDELLTIRKAASKREFDILLVFKDDRIGRNADELPYMLNFLHKCDVEVWTTQEGQIKLENQADKLMTYVRFWQSESESVNKSQHVRETKKLLSQQGFFQGGVAPYGYKIVETDQKHPKKRDRNLKILLPDLEESKIVQLIYSMYIVHHKGYRKIVDFLNEEGYRKRNQELFTVNTIQRILHNPIYIGLKRYKSFDGKDGDTQPFNEKLRILTDDLYFKAQEITKKRKEAINFQDKTGIPLAGKLLFSGLAYCEYCGDKLQSNYIYRKDNGAIIYRYRCPGNKGNNNHKKNMWGAKKFDSLIINEIKAMLSLINIEKYIDSSVNKKKEKLETKEKNVKSLEREKDKLILAAKTLNKEIANSLLGSSKFTPDQLSTALELNESKVTEITIQLESLKEELQYEKDNYSDIIFTARELDQWEIKFDNAEDDLKKAMLSRIIKKVYLSKDKIEVDFAFDINEIMATQSFQPILV
ncbi:recombinase family protein [Peribacillus deserti]|uniref:Site-specific recombinase n=1 Tax=Peribacillus deserti TaxID=673318 RepID=A0A2N5M4H0_9BACI|nr:recombinase family protein [Peribacillus deserti]PLT29259.1 site-specific recombinase [Peribacillus deserti]